MIVAEKFLALFQYSLDLPMVRLGESYGAVVSSYKGEILELAVEPGHLRLQLLELFFRMPNNVVDLSYFSNL